MPTGENGKKNYSEQNYVDYYKNYYYYLLSQKISSFQKKNMKNSRISAFVDYNIVDIESKQPDFRFFLLFHIPKKDRS